MAEAPFTSSQQVGAAYQSPGLDLLPRPLLWKAVLILGVPLLLVLLLAIHPWTFGQSGGSSDSGYQFGLTGPNNEFPGGYQTTSPDTYTDTYSEPATTETTETTASGDPQTEANAVTALLNQAKTDRGNVGGAVTDAANCGDLPADLAALQSAQTDRQNLAQQAGSLDVDALDGASSVPGLLDSAFTASATADGDYISWIGDLQQSCAPGTATDDLYYQNGYSDSQTADTAKETLLNTWNSVALQYGQPQFATTDI